MNLTIGIKTDPIEYRYSFDWLFDLLEECGVGLLQLGSFFELYSADDAFFVGLRKRADHHGLRFKSVFTAHRELGGFFTGDRHLEKVARQNYERLIHVAAVLGADFAGSNPGAVFRDRPDYKTRGIKCYLDHMHELLHAAKDQGLRGLTIEPMSSVFEPPSLPDEIAHMMSDLAHYHRTHPATTVPAYLCGDISHGVADRDGRVLHGNEELFERQIPWMAEFHLKNTDTRFGSTFGFSPEETAGGIVDLHRLLTMIDRNADCWPLPEITGYLEIGGPKLGRDYSDWKLAAALKQSLAAVKDALTPLPSGGSPDLVRPRTSERDHACV